MPAGKCAIDPVVVYLASLRESDRWAILAWRFVAFKARDAQGPVSDCSERSQLLDMYAKTCCDLFQRLVAWVFYLTSFNPANRPRRYVGEIRLF